jgi:UDP-2,3-diacylglucosamine pyrophosphatase LpxH
MEKFKTIWISDIHLGTRGCKADQLCRFLKTYECETLYLVGDIIDGWKLTRSWHWPQEHSNVIRRLLTKAKRGTNIVYIVGNHDEFLRPWLKHKLAFGNLTISNQIIHIDLKGRKWLVTHGDMFDQVTRHWKWLSILGDRAYTIMLIANGILHKIRNKFGFGYWSLSKWLKSKAKQAINFIYKFEEHLATHAANNNCYGVICGHIHTPAIKEINGIIYANDGDWVETCSALVETYDGEFKLLILNLNGEMQVMEFHP